jgi:hypothetical protein
MTQDWWLGHGPVCYDHCRALSQANVAFSQAKSRVPQNALLKRLLAPPLHTDSYTSTLQRQNIKNTITSLQETRVADTCLHSPIIIK